MAPSLDRLNLMIAHAAASPWPAGLEESLARLPVEFHWSRTDSEAVRLAVSGLMHVAVVDDALPRTGGLALLRRMRHLGLEMPCLLVCDNADERLLQEALALGVYSVAPAGAGARELTPLVMQAVNRRYRLNWPVNDWMN